MGKVFDNNGYEIRDNMLVQIVRIDDYYTKYGLYEGMVATVFKVDDYDNTCYLKFEEELNDGFSGVWYTADDVEVIEEVFDDGYEFSLDADISRLLDAMAS